MKTNDASLTPAVLAKNYADAHGMVIIKVERRYQIQTKDALELIDEVGGYPAALNAMKRHVEALQDEANTKRELAKNAPYDTEQKLLRQVFVSVNPAPSQNVEFRDLSPEQKQRVREKARSLTESRKKHYVVTTKIGDEWLPVAGAAYESYAEAIRYCRQLRNSKLSSADRPRRVEYRA